MISMQDIVSDGGELPDLGSHFNLVPGVFRGGGGQLGLQGQARTETVITADVDISVLAVSVGRVVVVMRLVVQAVGRSRSL